MDAEIYFREGGNTIISNLTQIIRPSSSGGNKTITDFSQFFLWENTNFTFVGESETVSVNSEDILYVKFCN